LSSLVGRRVSALVGSEWAEVDKFFSKAEELPARTEVGEALEPLAVAAVVEMIGIVATELSEEFEAFLRKLRVRVGDIAVYADPVSLSLSLCS